MLELSFVFQVVIIVGGNLSFLNWLTILPAIMCFDDRALASLFPCSTRDEVLAIQEEEERGDIRRPLGGGEGGGGGKEAIGHLGEEEEKGD